MAKSKYRNKIIGLMAVVVMGTMAAKCDDQATVAHRNLDTAADNFELHRQIIFYNAWQDIVMSTFTGFCSVKDETTKFQVVCKDSTGVKRHQVGRTQNVTYQMVQLEPADVSTYHTRILWPPQTFIPDFQIITDSEELLSNKAATELN